ncbi:hypothetical protein [Natronococcus wangiae]|nr:hypothetical protein [Natronococcus sp. AD5]
MGVFESLRERARNGTTLYECRNCGETLAEGVDECPSCGSEEIAHYEI